MFTVGRPSDLKSFVLVITGFPRMFSLILGIKIVQGLSLNWLLCYFFFPFDIDASIQENSNIKREKPQGFIETSAVTTMN